ncbi:SBDS-like protein [Trypanosoma rangeli]|uniref:SBDS-like protein n=1 Tax=Trypanosoma rangeli TaxID=5698 RepID=A0A422NGQ3_TRYRA|nr:SBDS-like protein [Trypanosoma rangeli]RNF04641.1 SBDS-like protein [Trypanosoma rangeli]|eukprot:RNF04641.1 SBDS-like protein [Trypanosoma rangeli]
MQFPLSQRRHTNVAVVRYTKNGLRLEIACYKNKVISYRGGIETRMDEVLQVERVFTNVSRGLYASEKEIQTVFGKGASEKEALQYILDHGELQVAQQERAAEIDQMFIDIAVIISQKCLNEVTQRPFPSQVIEQALRSIGAVVKLDQPVKKQALALIHQLIDAKIIPIARARMKLRCIAPDEPSLEKLVEWCESNDVSILRKTVDTGGADGAVLTQSLVILLQPHLFREIEKFVKSELPPGGTVHMIENAAVDVGEGGVMDAELIARANAHVAGAGGVGNADTSRFTGSSSSNPQNDSIRGNKRGKGGGRKPQGMQRVLSKDGDTDQQTSATAELSSIPAEADRDGDDLMVALSKLALDEKCVSDDEEADGKGRRGKKAKRRQGRQPQQRLPATPKKAVGAEGGEGSDDEMLANRKQRKQAAAKVKTKDDGANHGWNDDDDDAYGYNCEEEEEGGGGGECRS